MSTKYPDTLTLPHITRNTSPSPVSSKSAAKSLDSTIDRGDFRARALALQRPPIPKSRPSPKDERDRSPSVLDFLSPAPSLIPAQYHIHGNAPIPTEDHQSAELDFAQMLEREEGLKWQSSVFPSSKPVTRKDAIFLDRYLEEMTELVQREKGTGDFVEYLKEMQNLFSLCMHELIRQVSGQCTERGHLLAKIWIRFSELFSYMLKNTDRETQKSREREAALSHDLEILKSNYYRDVEKMNETVLQSAQTIEYFQNELLKKQAEVTAAKSRKMQYAKHLILSKGRSNLDGEKAAVLLDEAASMMEENESLKKQIAQLKAELEKKNPKSVKGDGDSGSTESPHRKEADTQTDEDFYRHWIQQQHEDGIRFGSVGKFGDSVQSSTTSAAFIPESFVHFFSQTSFRGSHIVIKSVDWLHKLQTHLYNLKIQRDADREVEGKHRETFPEFVFQFYLNAFGTKIVAQQKLLEFFAASRRHFLQDIRTRTFSCLCEMDESEIYSLDCLTVYLHALSRMRQFGSGYSEREGQRWITPKVWQNIIRSVFEFLPTSEQMDLSATVSALPPHPMNPEARDLDSFLLILIDEWSVWRMELKRMFMGMFILADKKGNGWLSLRDFKAFLLHSHRSFDLEFHFSDHEITLMFREGIELPINQSEILALSEISTGEGTRRSSNTSELPRTDSVFVELSQNDDSILFGENVVEPDVSAPTLDNIRFRLHSPAFCQIMQKYWTTPQSMSQIHSAIKHLKNLKKMVLKSHLDFDDLQQKYVQILAVRAIQRLFRRRLRQKAFQKKKEIAKLAEIRKMQQIMVGDSTGAVSSDFIFIERKANSSVS